MKERMRINSIICERVYFLKGYEDSHRLFLKSLDKNTIGDSHHAT